MVYWLRVTMSNRAPQDDERAARHAAQRKAWNDAHPNYYTDYRERNLESIRKKNRERERRRTQRERDEKERRQKGSERAKEWARQHPEERQQARERYKQKHPDAYKQAQREYYRNRDAIAERRRARDAADPEKANEAHRRAVARARAAGRPGWSPSPSQHESYRQRENEARRLQRRRARAGLPDRRLRHVLTAERRHNDAAADAFFARKRSRKEVARIREQDLPTPPELVHALQERSENRRAIREILAVADAYFADHEIDLRARVAEISRTRFRAGLLPLDVYTEPRRALEVASTGYLRRSAVSQTSSLAVFKWLTSDLAKRAPDILL